SRWACRAASLSARERVDETRSARAAPAAGRLIAACAPTRDRTDATVSLARPRPTRHVARRGRSLAGRALGPRCSGRSFGRRSRRSFARRSRRSFARLHPLEDAPLAATRGALIGAGIHEAVLALRRAGAAR